MTEVKLLTEAEAEDLIRRYSGNALLFHLRERGLIAPEPEPEPLAKEVEALLSTYWDTEWGARDLALAALRRGMELAKPELTREMVRDALGDAAILEGDGPTSFDIDRLHAALTRETPDA